MPARVVHFPVPGNVEPITVRRAMMSWRCLPDGSEVDAQTRECLVVRPDGTWTLSIKQQGKGLWRHLSGDASTPMLEYFRAVVGLQFEDRDRAAG